MSLYGFEILRCDGKLFAYTRIQNEWNGNISCSFKRVYRREGRCYFKADGRNHDCTDQVSSYVKRENDRAAEHEFYIKYKGRIM